MDIGNERRKLKQGERRRSTGYVGAAFLHGANGDLAAPQMAFRMLEAPSIGSIAHHDMDGTTDKVNRDPIDT